MSDRYVNYTRTPDGVQADFGFAGFAPVNIDQSKLPQQEKSSPCKHFLAAAAECCFSGTLGGAIIARGGTYTAINATAEILVTKNEQNIDRITGIELYVNVHAPKAQRDVVEKCAEHMKNGCFITQSLDAAIKCQYHVELIFE